MPESDRSHLRGGFHMELHIHSYEEWLAFCAGIRGLRPADIARFNENVAKVDAAGNALGDVAQQLGGISTDPPTTK